MDEITFIASAGLAEDERAALEYALDSVLDSGALSTLRDVATQRAKAKLLHPPLWEDSHGRGWPEINPYFIGDLRFHEVCDVCGQPDNVGECQHGALSVDDVFEMGGLPTLAEAREYDSQ